MDIATALMIIGICLVIASFFVGGSSRKYNDELEKVSMSLHQETSHLKKRLKTVEDELMIAAGPLPSVKPQSAKRAAKPIHEIIINQILSLHAQGYSVDEIAKRSSLSNEDVRSVLQTRGMLE